MPAITLAAVELYKLGMNTGFQAKAFPMSWQKVDVQRKSLRHYCHMPMLTADFYEAEQGTSLTRHLEFGRAPISSGRRRACVEHHFAELHPDISICYDGLATCPGCTPAFRPMIAGIGSSRPRDLNWE